jgi:immunoglobulin-binding protein 1
LFSSNEDKDDLTTGEIKYLLIPYYKAEILSQQHQNYAPRNDTSPDNDDSILKQQKSRLESLKSSETLHEKFLLKAQQYDLLSSGALKCIFGVVESTSFSSVAAQPPKVDASTLRQLKIEKFKLEKSVAARVQALSHRLDKKSTNGTEEENDDQDDDEAAERELQLLKIEAAALKSIESLRSVRQEIDVLQHATSLTDTDRRKRQSNSNLSSSPTDQQQLQTQEMLAELRKAAGALKLGQEASHRESLRQAVFQPSHLLPTLTVEQQGDIEVAQILAQQRAEAEKSQKMAALKAERGRKGDDSEEDDEYDDKVYRQRAMDDWKDDNPRGWGNSKLKPCG